MPHKSAKTDDKAQKKRFIEKAKELEVDESETTFEEAFKKVVPPKDSNKPRRTK